MKPTPLLLLLLVPILLLASACGDDGSGAVPTNTTTPADSPSIKDTPSGAVTTDAEPTATSAGDDIGPVSNEPIAFQTPDGVIIHGHLYSVAGPKQKVVILAHEYGADQTNWTPFAKELALKGIAALTFDFRGYGESEGDQETDKVDLDLETAVLLMRSQDYPLIYVAGASMGGTATLKVAARQDVAGIIVMSAPESIRGLDAGEDVASITAPKLFMAASGDTTYASAMETLLELAAEPKQRLLLEGDDHGTALLRGDAQDQVKQAIFEFLGQ